MSILCYLRFLRAIWSPAPTVRDLTLNLGDVDSSWPSLSCKVLMLTHKYWWHILMSHRVIKNVLHHLVRSLLSDFNLISDVGVFADLEKSFGIILSVGLVWQDIIFIFYKWFWTELWDVRSSNIKHRVTIDVERFHPIGLGLVTTVSTECTELISLLSPPLFTSPGSFDISDFLLAGLKWFVIKGGGGVVSKYSPRCPIFSLSLDGTSGLW